MSRSIAILLYAIIALVIGGSLEEMLPKSCGVGLPILLVTSILLARRRHPAAAVIFAVAAGAIEDALSMLPLAASPLFFAAAAVLAHFARLPPAAALAAFPVYEIWIWLAGGLAFSVGELCARLALAIPVGALAFAVISPVIAFADTEAALDEA